MDAREKVANKKESLIYNLQKVSDPIRAGTGTGPY